MNTDSREQQCVRVNFVPDALLSKLTHTVNLYSGRHLHIRAGQITGDINITFRNLNNIQQ